MNSARISPDGQPLSNAGDEPMMPRSTTTVSAVSHTGSDPLQTRLTMSDEETMQDAAVAQLWQPLFGSPVDTLTPGLQNFLDDWQTTDWLDLDSSAFTSLPSYNEQTSTWMGT